MVKRTDVVYYRRNGREDELRSIKITMLKPDPKVLR